MRHAMVLSAACLCMLIATLAFGQQFPYTAQVGAETPYYGKAEIADAPAGQLPAGSTIEVYRHDGDWLVIRPPAESFSWVSTRDVEATNMPGVVQVRSKGAICWIGHAGSQNRTISQISLEQGEVLQVSGDSLVGDETEVRQWYRIAPPAGEFRFVHSRHAGPVANPAPAVAAIPAGTGSWSIRPAPPGQLTTVPSRAPQTTPAAVTPVVATLPVSTTGVATGSERDIQQRLAVIDQQLTEMLTHPPQMWNPAVILPELQTFMASAPTADLRSQAQETWTRAVRAQQIQQGYAQVASGIQTTVQPAVAQMPQPVVAPVVTPVVTPVSAPRYVETPSPYAQGPLNSSVQLRPAAPPTLIARVRQAAFEISEAVQTGGQGGAYGRLDGAANPSAVAGEPEVVDWPKDENGHSGTGWLMPLVARTQMPLEMRSAVPPLALTDDEGNVKFLVTPVSGANFREYLRKEVGLVGAVTRLPGIATPHITAQRVVVLERVE